jgi:predicted dehydrogenase
MSQVIRVGIIGAGRPAQRHAEGYHAAGGFQLAAVADPLNSRRTALAAQFSITRMCADAKEVIDDPRIDLVSVCLPNDLHGPVVIAALKAGKHVVCATPPAHTLVDAKKMAAAAEKSGKTLLYAAQRRFGGAEQAAVQAIAKGYIGEVRHVRASWMRTRGTPTGTGWFADKSRSGGGALLDLGLPMLDLGWAMMGQPAPQSVFAVAANHLTPTDAAGAPDSGVESVGFALIRFSTGQSLELAASWTINQPSRHQGTVCRVHGKAGAIDLYTPEGPMLSRKFDEKGTARETPLKLPKVIHYAAMMRHLKRCIAGMETPLPGAREGIALMRMMEGIYKSAEAGRSVQMG